MSISDIFMLLTCGYGLGMLSGVVLFLGCMHQENKKVAKKLEERKQAREAA